MNNAIPFKVLIAQIDNQYQFNNTTKRILSSLSKYSPKDLIDFLIFPEMALIGYYYPDKQSIQPHLELYAQGPTYHFCKQLALQLNSYVVCGYPEIYQDKFYNSAIVVDRQGNPILNIRKKHLFETDKTWASEGQSFNFLDITTIQGNNLRLVFGICMDLNPYEFKDNSQFELAQYCKEQKADGLIFLSAWNDHEPENEDQNGMLNYWVWRLHPLVDRADNKNNKKFVFICSDKCGKDEKTEYVGTSCVIKLNPVQLVQNLEKKKESYLLCEIQL